MGKDLLGGLGGLVKGLSSFMPQDDPDVKLFNAQAELSELRNQETELLAQIGKEAIASYGLASFGASGEKLQLVQSNLALLEKQTADAKKEQELANAQKQEALAERTCSACGMVNEEGVRFCQECGTRLGPKEKRTCPECGAAVEQGIRFCGSCGHRMEE